MVKANFTYSEEISSRVQLIHNIIFYHSLILGILFFFQIRQIVENWFLLVLSLIPLIFFIRVYFISGKKFYFSFWSVYSMFLFLQLILTKAFGPETNWIQTLLYFASLVCFGMLFKLLVNPLFYQMTYRWALNKQRYGIKVEIVKDEDKIFPGRIYTKGKDGYLISFENLPLAKELTIKFENGASRNYTLLTKRIESFGDQIFYGIRRV